MPWFSKSPPAPQGPPRAGEINAPAQGRSVAGTVRRALRLAPAQRVETGIPPLPLSARASPTALALGRDPAPSLREGLLAVDDDVPPPAPLPGEVAQQLMQFARDDGILADDEALEISGLIQSGPLDRDGLAAADRLLGRCLDKLRWGARTEGPIALSLVRWVNFPDRADKAVLVCGNVHCQLGKSSRDAILELLGSGGLGDASLRIVDGMLDGLPEDEKLDTHLRWVQERRFGDQTDAHAMALWHGCMDRERLNNAPNRNYSGMMEGALAILESGVLGDRTASALLSFLNEFERRPECLDVYMLSGLKFSTMLETGGITPQRLAEEFPKAAEQVQRRPESA